MQVLQCSWDVLQRNLGMPLLKSLLGLLPAKVLPHEDVEEVASRLGEKLVELVGGRMQNAPVRPFPPRFQGASQL